MKIIILNGSSRKNGNTKLLVDSFIEGAKNSGNEVLLFNLMEMKIKPCLGCSMGGKSKDRPCVQLDDIQQIYKEYFDADVIVFASPLYYWSISGILKCAIDRLYAIDECVGGFLKKKSILLMTSHGTAYDAVKKFYDFYVEKMGWQDLGIIFANGMENKGDIINTKYYKDAYKLGCSIHD